MKFELSKVSTCSFDEEVEINTLEELKELQDRYSPINGLIVDFERKSITIYDDYVE